MTTHPMVKEQRPKHNELMQKEPPVIKYALYGTLFYFSDRLTQCYRPKALTPNSSIKVSRHQLMGEGSMAILYNLLGYPVKSNLT